MNTAPAAIIETTDELARLCKAWAKDPYIALDTEFIREKTYYPQLCLVQVAGTHESAAIDALAPGIDLTPLDALLADRHVLKVLHASRQDMEIFYHRMGEVPGPLFDTQVAAQVCGFGESVGYEALIKRLLGIAVDKSSRFTDWARRPLSQRQIAYAMADVIHLREAYEKLVAQIGRTERMHWIEEELAELANPALYDGPAEEAWRRLKTNGKSRRMLAILREIAAWREREARVRDVPKSRLVRDETLLELASYAPQNMEQMAHMRGLERLSPAQRKGLFAAVEQGRAVPAQECPAVPERPEIPEGGEAALEILKMLLKIQCLAHHVAPTLVATSEDLTALICGDKEVHLLHGWRHEVFGKQAQALLAGRLSLRLDPAKGEVVVEEK